MNSLPGLIAKYLWGRQVYLDCDDSETGVGHFSSRWQKLGVEFFEQKMPFWVDFITTHTYFNRDRIVDSGVSPERVFYLSNGVDRTRFIPPAPDAVQELRNRLGLNGKKVVLFLGSLSRPSHPVELLLKAFKQVIQVEPLARLLLVGGGDDYNALVEQVQQMGMGDFVRLTGRVSPEQVVHYYYLADVSVDPVYDDGAARGRSPLKLFESWACGVPFITANVGDRKILIGEPPAGLLAYPGDPDSLSDAIQNGLNNPELAKILRQRGYQRVQGYYWDILARELDSIYQKNFRAAEKVTSPG
jgi:glycosyltransferase involved in cell wall biosynthesis